MSQVGLKLSGFCVQFTVLIMFQTIFGENKEKKLIEKVKYFSTLFSLILVSKRMKASEENTDEIRRLIGKGAKIDATDEVSQKYNFKCNISCS